VTGSAEGGSNSGSDFEIRRHNDAGTVIESALTIYRDNNFMELNGFVYTYDGFAVDTPPGSYKGYSLNASGNARWFVGSESTAESGSNAGANFVIERYADGGGFLGTPFQITRSSGLITLGSGQLAFPATQNPSSDANVLDDYEEGTWTPTLTPSAGAFGSITYAAAGRYGHYTKIGALVFCTCRVTLTAWTVGTATTSVGITGLPFTSVNATAGQWVGGGHIAFANAGTTTNGFGALVVANSSLLNLYTRGASATYTSAALAPANLSTTFDVIIHFTYRAS
jgi:hypothetical protein